NSYASHVRVNLAHHSRREGSHSIGVGQVTIRIMIADDHSIVREGLRMFLGRDPELEIVGEAADGAEAVEQARVLRPDVVLMDLLMPVMDGIAATSASAAHYPRRKSWP